MSQVLDQDTLLTAPNGLGLRARNDTINIVNINSTAGTTDTLTATTSVSAPVIDAGVSLIVGGSPFTGANIMTTNTVQTVTANKTFSGQVAITNPTASVSSVTGALVVTGGIGTSGAVNTTGNVNTAGDIICVNAQVSGTVTGPVAQSFNPPGTVLMYGGAAAPSGYLLCDGASYLRAAFPALFAIIGTTFGAVDGLHFNVPNMNGFSPAGVGAPYGAAVGSTSGAATVTLNNTTLPSHTHVIVDPGHSHPFGAAATHHHLADTFDVVAVVNPGTTLFGPAGTGGNANQTADAALPGNTTTSATGITAANTGTGNPFGIIPPSLSLNFIIKT